MNEFETHIRRGAEDLSLTPQEKSTMRAVLHRAMDASHSRSIPTPYWRYSFTIPRVALVSFLMIAVAGSGTVYAAQGSLPGDVLYPVKVQLTEPVQGAVQFSAQSKEAWNAQVAEERAKEAETLAAQGKLTQPAADEIAANLSDHVSAASTLIDQEDASDTPDSTTQSARLGAALAVHSAILEELVGNATTTPEGRATAALAHKLLVQSSILLKLQQQDETYSTSTATSSDTSFAVGRGEPRGTSAKIHGEGDQALSSASSSALATSTTSTVFSSDDADRMRSDAADSLSEIETQFSASGSNLDEETASRIHAALSDAHSAIVRGDSMAESNPRAALSEYRTALLTAVSLKTALTAQTQLNGSSTISRILPRILENDGGDSSTSQSGQ